MKLSEFHCRQRMVEGAKIFAQPLAAAGFGDDYDVVTRKQPRERGLGRRHAVVARECRELLVLEQARLLERRIGHHRYVPLAQPCQQVPFDAAPREVVEQLVCRNFIATGELRYVLHVGKIEVGNAIVADFAGILQGDQRLKRFRERYAAPPMQEI